MGDEGLDPADALAILRNAGDPIVVVDSTAMITWVNDAVRTFGWEPDELLGRSGLELLGPTDVERALLALGAIASGHPPPSSAPYDIPSADGTTIECDVAGWVAGDPSAPSAVALHLRPTQDSRVLRHLLQRLLDGSRAAEALQDMLGLLYHRNPYARVIVTFTDEDGAPGIAGHALDERLGGVGVDGDSPWAQAQSTGQQVLVEGTDALPAALVPLARDARLRDCWIVPVGPAGEPIATITVWASDSGPSVQLDSYSVHLLAQLIELVLRWRSQTRELERAATRDPLTGLPNRRAVAEFDAEGPRRNIGVLYLDLDRFKPVNDRLGHAAGDQVLRTIATRLQSAVRPTDIVARLGGDEFGILCPGCEADELQELAERVQELVSDPIGVHTDVVSVGASIGVARGHDSAGPLLERADRALYDAKERGRGGIAWAAATHAD